MLSQELLQKAIAEAYACADQDIIPLYAVEIYHRNMVTPARLLRWPLTGPKPKVFTLRHEASAIYDPGKLVTYLGVPFDVTLPEKGSDSPGSFTFKISHVGDSLDDQLEAAALGGGIINAVFRVYIKGEEASGPADYSPGINLRSPKIDPASGDLVCVGTVLDWLTRKFGNLYTRGRYPALV